VTRCTSGSRENTVILDSLHYLTRTLRRRSHAYRFHRLPAARRRAGLFSVTVNVDELDDAALEALADRLAPLIAERLASPPGLLTPHEAARRTGVHVETIRRAVRTGALPASRAGRAVRIDADDLDRWLRVDHGARSHAGRSRPRPRAAGRRPLADAFARP
jgi:excisionase family DNA binding protein